MIQVMYNQGYSKKRIARELGISINTVRKYIKSDSSPCYSARAPRAMKLDPYRQYIKQRIADSNPHWVPATVIFREIKAKGYDGGISMLRRYMHQQKPEASESTIVRFETAPGHQMQADWAEFRKGKARLSAFIATLGYSRASYVEFVEDEKLETLLKCHENAFDYFGGVPMQVLYDNMKTVITARDYYGKGKHRLQSGFWDFSKHYNFTPKVCRPYRAQTKGKVERFIHYLKYSFYHPLTGQLKPLGLTVDKELANEKVLSWLNDVANKRIHATTGEEPFSRLQSELLHLQHLPGKYTGSVPQPEVSASTLVSSLPSESIETQHIQHQLSVYDELLKYEGVSV